MKKNKIICDFYKEGLSLKQIATKLSLNYNTIRYHLKKGGIKLNPRGRIKKYIFNENFFTTPNNLNSYWAGFIAADFHLRSEANTNKKSRNCAELSCSLGIKDKEQLIRFMNDIEHLSPIRIRKRKRKGKNIVSAEISITSHTILHDLLINFNIQSGDKTNRLFPPTKLNRENQLSFILGYMDGDGWLQYKKNINMGVCGTYEIVSWIKTILDKELLNAKITGPERSQQLARRVL